MQQVYNHKLLLTINEHKISSNTPIIVYTKYRDHVKPSHHTKTCHDFKMLYKMACPFNFFVLQFQKKINPFYFYWPSHNTTQMRPNFYTHF